MLPHAIFQVLFVALVLQTATASLEEQCQYAGESCERCLSAHLDCAWCTDRTYDVRSRCFSRNQLIRFGCNASEIFENKPHMEHLEQQPLKDYETVDDQAVQVTPQRVKLTLVKGHTQRIQMNYRPASNNPLDLYTLMDLTWTMRDDKDTLVKLGTELTHTLRNLTGNYRLGFGSFADKPAMPMIMPQLYENPCAAERGQCEPTYGFRHKLQLTEDIEAFVAAVASSNVTGNLDNLEGGLDALMQVIVCTDPIGWKPQARKVVLLVTDGFMHFAGDGLLAGITQRNDRQCHLNEMGLYTGSLVYDYPSLEEIYRELLRRKISVIFAVTAPVVSTYRQISELMHEISNVEMLTADSSNILELIKKSYETFIKRTQFTDNSPDFIKLSYFTDCGEQFPSLRERSYCNNVKLGEEIEFFIDVTLVDYPENGIYNHKIRVEEATLNEFMEIEVELQAPCPCQEEPKPYDEYGRFQCSDHGYLHCGMCKCDDEWIGSYCSCPTNPSNAITNDALLLMCRRPSGNGTATNTDPICSNHGECGCGSCVCDPGYSGKYCECRDCLDCDEERADCYCGKCICKYGWSGSSCNCNELQDKCIGPNGEICSQRGICDCNECICDHPYLGKFCEINTETDNKLCQFYEPCVACLIQQKMGLGSCTNLSEVCSSVQYNERFTYGFVDELNFEVRCLVRITNKDGLLCDNYFSYRVINQANYLAIQVVECMEPLVKAGLFIAVLVITFLLGLLIICLARWWSRHQFAKQEYARFEESMKDKGANMENPIYRDPVGRYVVPRALSAEYKESVSENPFAS